MEYTVTVTQADIDGGVRNKCTKCPVALALKRLFPGRRISVANYSIKVGSCLERMPSEVISFVSWFDIGRAVQPFSFPLTLPDEVTL